MYMKEMVWGEISPQNEKNSQIKIANAHIHILRNNPAKFHNNPMDSLSGVADDRFRTYGRTGRKDKGNLEFPRFTEVAGHNNILTILKYIFF